MKAEKIENQEYERAEKFLINAIYTRIELVRLHTICELFGTKRWIKESLFSEGAVLSELHC